MTQAEDDERWLQVLSGRAPATDAATRTAQQLRGYYGKQAAAELQDADDATYTRAMNHLRASGAFAKPAAPPARPNPIAGFFDWLFPPKRSSGRYAMVAAVVLAVLVAPLVLRGPDEDSQIKRAPPIEQPGTTRPAPGGPAETVLSAPDPEPLARDIEAALIAAGVVPRVDVAAGQATITATLKAGDLPVVRAALQPYAVAPPADGRLRIVIRRQ